MPLTEVIIPSFKQDSNTKEMMQKMWPSASSVFQRIPAIQCGQAGSIILNNGVDARSNLNTMCLFEWQSIKGFEAFFLSAEFETFIGQVGPFLSGPPQPQMFETDIALRDLEPSPVTEIVRIRTGPSFSREKVWGQLITTIERHSGHSCQALCGRSVNLEEELWLGIITWESNEARENICKKPEVESALQTLLHGQEPDIVIAEMQSLVLPRD